MPRTRIARRPVKEKERFFVQLYLKYGAQLEKLAYCEKRACLKKGHGAKILRRKSVKEEIRAKTVPVLQEQMRQSVIGDAAKIAQQVMEEKLAQKVALAKKLKIEKKVLDGVLMEMVLGLDKNFYPKELLDAIKAAYIVVGSVKSNSLELIEVPEPGAENRTVVYTSLFDRLRAEKTGKAKTPQSTPEVFDLFPPIASASVSKTVSETSEPIEKEPPAKEKEKPSAKDAKKPERRVVTVEIG